jgi:hypothetical protein
MLMMMTAAALAAGQPAATPASQSMQMQMQMPAGHDMPMNREQHAAMMDKCCCEHMGDKGHDMHAPNAERHEHGE